MRRVLTTAKLAVCVLLCLPAACGAQARAPADEEASNERNANVEHTPKPPDRPNPKAKHAEVAATTAVVTRVVDGDTIEAAYRGAVSDIRLIGIDTPETVHPSQPVGCFGPAASSFTTAALTGDTVRLEFDVERRDHYGRKLAYVWHKGRLFNRILVRRGLATVSTYPPNDKYVERFTAAQQRAKAANQGLWKNCSTTPSAPAEVQTGSSAGACDGYSPCLEPASDYDCAGGNGDGPRFAQGPIKVSGADPYELDSDGDGIACEPTY